MKNLNQYKKFFGAIPDSKWIEGRLHSGDGKRSCALGHLDNHNKSSTLLGDLFIKYIGTGIPSINDQSEHPCLKDALGEIPKSPKGRILAAINYIQEVDKAEMEIAKRLATPKKSKKKRAVRKAAKMKQAENFELETAVPEEQQLNIIQSE